MIFQQNGIDFSKIVDISIDDDPDVETSQDSDVTDPEAPLAPLASELGMQINGEWLKKCACLMSQSPSGKAVP